MRKRVRLTSPVQAQPVVTGARNRTCWPRPVLINLGALLMLTPLAVTLLDSTFGTRVVTVR